MAEPLRCPPTPCNTCPYRRDTPPGIWDASEYRKLPEYDAGRMALSTFHCHQEHATGMPTVCRGWLAVHRFDSIAVRLAVARGLVEPEQVEAPCPVPLYGSGAEACAAGLGAVRRPGRRARRAIAKLARRLPAEGAAP